MDSDDIKRMIMKQRQRTSENPRTIEAAPNVGDVVVLILAILVVGYFFVDILVGVLL
jgi:hypothetical protein